MYDLFKVRNAVMCAMADRLGPLEDHYSKEELEDAVSYHASNVIIRNLNIDRLAYEAEIDWIYEE
jgi:hypothetical protein